MYPPHHFGGYELIWQSAMRHLERHGHTVRVLTTDLDIGATEPDDANVRRDLIWYWRDHGFPRLSRVERVRLERHNARLLDRELREVRPDVVSWWSMGGMSLSMLERVRRLGLPAVAFVIDDWLAYGPDVDGWIRVFANRSPHVASIAERVMGHAIAGVAGTYDRYAYREEKSDALRRLADLIDTIVHPRTADVLPLRKGKHRKAMIHV